MSALTELLAFARHHAATDVLLATGQPAVLRRHGLTLDVHPRADHDAALAELLDDPTGDRLQDAHATTFALDTPVARVRAHVARHTHGLTASLHLVPAAPPALTTFALPSTATALVTHASGLVLVAGPRGSGRSSTLASLLRHRMTTRRGHALTLEAPIEIRFGPADGPITQRELGGHTPSLAEALREATRHDVDTVLVADLSAAEPLAQALALAESGALVLGAVSAPDATSTLERLVSRAPARSQDACRARLAEQLRLVIAQRLVPGADGVSHHAACEVLVNTATVSAAIRSGTFGTLASALAAGGRAGSRTLDAALADLVSRGLVSRDEALVHAMNPGAFAALAPPEAA